VWGGGEGRGVWQKTQSGNSIHASAKNLGWVGWIGWMDMGWRACVAEDIVSMMHKAESAHSAGQSQRRLSQQGAGTLWGGGGGRVHDFTGPRSTTCMRHAAIALRVMQPHAFLQHYQAMQGTAWPVPGTQVDSGA
jgi:hypothetical protein